MKMRKTGSINIITVYLIVFLSVPFPLAECAETRPNAPSGTLVIGQPGAVPQPQASDKISLDLKGMDVVEVIKMLATKGNLNIVLSDDVKGRVTIFLKSVNIMDAFEIILAANRLAYDKRGDIIHVMTQKGYGEIYGEMYADRKEVKVFKLKFAKAVEASKSLNQMKSKVGKIVVDEGSNTIVAIDGPVTISQMDAAISDIDMPTETKVFELRYAKAADLKPKITEILTKSIGALQIDERTNKIAVTDLQTRMPEIEKLVTAFDDRLQQVLIEAKIVQITLNDKFKLGVDWTAVMKQFGKEINLASMFQIAAQNALGPPGAQLVIGALNSTDWAAMVQILKTIGDADLLSSPRITALNNQEAKILIGTSTPYATNTVTQTTGLATTATNLSFLDIGVKLFVTPTINKDGFVTMKIRPEVSSQSGTYSYGGTTTGGVTTNATTVPIVTTTQAETSVTVKDGTTIVIAGLIKDERKSTVDKIPFLGDIPVVGMAFRKTVKEIEKQELVVFLTPHIITGEYDVMEQPKTYPIGAKKFTERENPTFERREPIKMDPGFFSKKGAAAIQEPKEDIIRAPEDYYSVLKERIVRNVQLPKARKGVSTKGDIKVTFMLLPEGRIASGPDIVGSSNHLLDGAAVNAITASAPFPPFPNSMGKEAKRFYITILTE